MHFKKGTYISCNNVCKSFGERQVLHNVSFRIAPSEHVVVLGSSGTGKSVLLKILLGLMIADSGSAELSSENAIMPGVLFQGCALFDSMNVLDNVRFILKNCYNERNAKEIAAERLSDVGIDKGSWYKMPHELSGGMKKRVALARAMAHNPDILLLDEPTSGLDPITSIQIARVIRQNIHASLSLTITHDLNVAREIGSRIIILDKAAIIYDGAIDGLWQSKEIFVQDLLRTASFSEN